MSDELRNALNSISRLPGVDFKRQTAAELLAARVTNLKNDCSEKEQRIRQLEDALRQQPCHCRTELVSQSCPQCSRPLYRVTRDPDSPLNEDQFDSVRAGDWYCTSCRGTEARTGYKYFWVRELKQQKIACARCAALSSAPAPKRCLITGNPCGTDTRPPDSPCLCANCSAPTESEDTRLLDAMIKHGWRIVSFESYACKPPNVWAVWKEGDPTREVCVVAVGESPRAALRAAVKEQG